MLLLIWSGCKVCAPHSPPASDVLKCVITLDELIKREVKFVKGWVGSIADVEHVPGTQSQVRTDIIVNASGLGTLLLLAPLTQC